VTGLARGGGNELLTQAVTAAPSLVTRHGLATENTLLGPLSTPAAELSHEVLEAGMQTRDGEIGLEALISRLRSCRAAALLGSVTSMARTSLYLTRHGEQDGAGPGPDGGLSAAGFQQADDLGRRLAAVEFSAVHHSPLARAVQTADALGQHLPHVPRHACGHAADRTPVPSATRRGEYPDRWLPWLDGVPDEERDEDAAELREAFTHLGATGDQDRCELLITHNFVIGWFVSQVLRTPAWRWIGLDSANGGLTIVTWETGKAPELVTFNDTGHLSPIAEVGQECPRVHDLRRNGSDETTSGPLVPPTLSSSNTGRTVRGRGAGLQRSDETNPWTERVRASSPP